MHEVLHVSGRPRQGAAGTPTLAPPQLAGCQHHLVDAAAARVVVARLPHLHASVPAEVVASPDAGVFAVVRRHPVGTMLGLYNVTEQPRQVPGWWVSELGLPVEQSVDALNGYPPNLSADGSVYLSTYQPVWLVRP